jgi:hypothetical protein
VCRKHGISNATFYKWKAEYGGLEVPDAKPLRALEDENAKLKRGRTFAVTPPETIVTFRGSRSNVPDSPPSHCSQRPAPI